MKIALVWGRFNPPHRGHGLLLATLEKYSEKGYEAILGLTRSEATPTDYRRAYRKVLEAGDDLKKRALILADEISNPLTFSIKKELVNRILQENNFTLSIFDNEKIRTIGELFTYLAENNKKDITLIAGSDEVPKYKEFIERHNNAQPLGLVVDAKVLSVGKRNPDSDIRDLGSIKGLSATKLRYYAVLDEFESFAKGLGTTNKDLAWDIFQATSRGMEIPEKYKVTKQKKKDALEESVLASYINDSFYGLG